MTAFYNERDPYAAEWLRNLIAAGHIAPGVVDERDIRDIAPNELAGFAQCHFFAGIGVWSHALRSAGWADDRPVWTGSCPCQPFSAAGQRGGEDDERHLWPHFFWLIDQCRPAIVLGEQVASKDGLNWLDLVSADMEGAGYAFGASDLCAAGFGGAHIRQRLYFFGVGLADPDNTRLEGRSRMLECADQRALGASGVAGGMADAEQWRRQGGAIGLAIPNAIEPSSECGVGRLADAHSDRRDEGRLHTGSRRREQAALVECGDIEGDRWAGAPMLGRHAADWLYCRDGKWRPVEPGTFPLADAAPARVGRLRAYGNALDAETASEFVTAVTMATSDIGAQP